MFFQILLLGEALVAFQGIYAFIDGYLTQNQMRSRGISNGWSFMEHGGMWADALVISPLVAYVASQYRLAYLSWYGLTILAAAVILSLFAGKMYAEGGKKNPEAHTHDGKTTVAGWIHGIFAVAGIWVIVMFFFTPMNPQASTGAILTVAGILTPFFYLGVKKFSQLWVFEKQAQHQVIALTIILWMIAGARILISHS